jgi:magnesium-transporting ATPase (P-type)
MDGPPALSLALEGAKKEYMSYPPVKRSVGIIDKRLFVKIMINSIIIMTIIST